MITKTQRKLVQKQFNVGSVKPLNFISSCYLCKSFLTAGLADYLTSKEEKAAGKVLPNAERSKRVEHYRQAVENSKGPVGTYDALTRFWFNPNCVSLSESEARAAGVHIWGLARAKFAQENKDEEYGVDQETFIPKKGFVPVGVLNTISGGYIGEKYIDVQTFIDEVLAQAK